MVKYLIFGNGFIGNIFANFLQDSTISYGRINTIDDIFLKIELHNPEIIINCIGKTGRPSIDWCEGHKNETFFSNVTIPTLMAEACADTDIYMVHIGSGCIYQSNNNENVWSEKDRPNFKGSFYSRTKIFSEKILSEYDNILIIRIRMPVDDKLGDRNLITKLVKYKKVLGDVPNSVTCIPDLMNAAKVLMDSKKTGIYNVVQYGAITHKSILEMYKKIVDPNFVMPEFIGTEQLKELTMAGRSNCILSTEKLENEGVKVKNVKDAITECLETYKEYVKGTSKI